MGGGERAKRSEVLKEERGGVQGRGGGGREEGGRDVCNLSFTRGGTESLACGAVGARSSTYFRSVVLGSLSVWVGGEGRHWSYFLITSYDNNDVTSWRCV